jgi:proton-translocating NADH-quinone oxidoreductase chain N
MNLVLNPVLIPAIGALIVLALDLVARPRDSGKSAHRSRALAGIRLGSVAVLSLVAVVFMLRGAGERFQEGLLSIDAFGVFGIGFVVVAGVLVLSLSLTHFGMARSRPAEPLALLLFAWSGAMAAMVTESLLVMFMALELAWLPMIALVAIDSRRLSSSESSLKAFFAHAFASLIFAHGIAFIFGATGRLDLGSLSTRGTDSSLLFGVGLTLILVGLLARGAVAPFHPWSPDVHEGAPSFVTTHIATIAQASTFFVLLRVLHSALDPNSGVMGGYADRVPTLLGVLGVIGLIWGHAMALVQVGLRRLVGWLGVGQVGFFVLALVDARGDGAHALILAIVASSISMAGVMATLSSLSHYERACEHIGDLAGMMQRSPVRAALLALFLLSLGGMPGTIGFIARFRILSSLEHTGNRWLMVAGLGATVLALTAIGRPLLAMLRPVDAGKVGSRALTNEQFVLAFCGLVVVYFGVMPIVVEANLAGQLELWIDRAVAALRPAV